MYYVKSYQLNHTDKYMLSDGTKIGKFIGINDCTEPCRYCLEGDYDNCIIKSYIFYNEATNTKYINGIAIFILGIQLDMSQ